MRESDPADTDKKISLNPTGGDDFFHPFGNDQFASVDVVLNILMR
jgi:hypothetical protein